MPEVEVKGFEILDLLHAGPNSDVYKAIDLASGEFVAIKHIGEQKLRSRKLFRHIQNEYRVGRILSRDIGGHPPPSGLTRLHELRTKRRLFRPVGYDLIMEYVPGDNLDDSKGFEVHEMALICCRIARTLRFMHVTGYCHADLKPSNILVTEDLGIKLIDFGLSCKIDSRFQSARGTPDYMAPEQVQHRRIDERTDIYNLGATMYRLLTGRLVPSIMPNPGGSLDEMFLANKQERAVPVRELNPNVPAPLSALIGKSCERKKRHRPQTIQAVITALEAAYPNLIQDTYGR